MIKQCYEQYKDELGQYENILVGPWNNGPSAPWIIGNFTKLYKEYGNPSTSEEFYTEYIKHRGIDPLINAGNAISKATGIDKEICYGWVYKKTCVEALKGCFMEWKMKEVAESHNYSFKFSTEYEDQNLGVDGKMYKDDNLIFTVQLKPVSFFRSDKPILMKKRKEMYEKADLSRNTLNAEPYLMIYDGDDWVMNGGSYLFKPQSVVDKDGNVIYS